jgi:inorganic triphosphatase YgiF
VSDQHQEIEFKLAVLDPGVLDELGSWRELAGFQLQPAMPRQIHDRYWDTPGAQLALAGSNLRLRQLDDQELFTLKGGATVTDGLFSRSELEVPANPSGWLALTAELRRLGLTTPPLNDDVASPRRWLAAAGFAIVQDRETQRRRLFARLENQPVAEIALDTTTFHLPAVDVTIREIEIEALTGASEQVVQIGTALAERLAGRVRPGLVGKFGAGLQLAARLDGFATSTPALQPA